MEGGLDDEHDVAEPGFFLTPVNIWDMGSDFNYIYFYLERGFDPGQGGAILNGGTKNGPTLRGLRKS